MTTYRLRTLLMVVTLIGGPLARIAYLKRMADCHRQQDAKFVNQLAADYLAPQRNFVGVPGIDRELIDATIQGQVDGELIIDVDLLQRERRWIVHLAPTTKGNTRFCTEDIALKWFTAAYHRRMAKKYEQAVFLPWQQVVIDRPPE